MSTRRIPLETNEAHLRLRVELDGTVVELRIDWLTRFEYFVVGIYDTEGDLILGGQGLHPGMDLLRRVPDIGGRLFLRGRAPTPENLDVDNSLRYEEPS